jgi:hypothetical protein
MPRLTAVQDRPVRRAGLGVLALLASALIVAFALASPASATTAACANPATLDGSAFEIDTDANLVVDTAGCIDWLTAGAGSSFRDSANVNTDRPSGSGDDSFGQGTAENNPNPTTVFGSIPPNKSDLKAFGVNTESGFLELFWSRVQNPSGTTNMDFELNKLLCDGTAATCANNGTSKSPRYTTPKRSVGDKLITYDLSQGGTNPGISIRSWTGTAWSAPTVISGAGQEALGSINTSGIPAAETGGLGSQDAYTFGEAAISFDALFGEGACGTFGSAYLKSRSSDSFTSEIKDFVAPEPVNVSNCPSGITTNATATVTVGGPISDTATLTVGAGATGTITFKLYSDASCMVEVLTGLTPVTVDGPGDYNSGTYNTTLVGTYYWIASYSGDATNDPSTGVCGDDNETSTVTKIVSAISTSQSVYPNDSATVTGGGSGNVHFQLFAGTTCSGTALVDQTKALSAGTAATTNTTVAVTASGTYSWLVQYAGDATHTAVTSTCSTERFVIDFTNG